MSTFEGQRHTPHPHQMASKALEFGEVIDSIAPELHAFPCTSMPFHAAPNAVLMFLMIT